MLLGDVGAYLGAVDPSGWTKADRVTKRVYKDEENADVVGRMIDVVRIHDRQYTVELIVKLVSRHGDQAGRWLRTSNARLITKHERTSVSLLPYRSTSQVSMMVQPIFNVLSIPPIINVNLRSMPRLIKIDGK